MVNFQEFRISGIGDLGDGEYLEMLKKGRRDILGDGEYLEMLADAGNFETLEQIGTREI